jgi:gamma-glutamyltranspeptidase / glutathione hydrolase
MTRVCRSFSFALLTVCISLVGCNTAPTTFTYQAFEQPEGASGITAKPGWAVSKFAVAAANPLATDAGYQVLKAGGSAVDAAIAVQLVLGLVEPQSSGIAGGAFLLHHDGKKTEAFDGRETAPAGANENLFMKDGKPLAFYDGVVGGRSVGVPGTMRMLEMAHKQHGKLSWAKLFEPAISLAEGGFKVSPRLHTLLKTEVHLKKDPVAAAYFYKPDGDPRDVGFNVRNQAYADVLKALAAQGSKALHEGPIAQAIVTKVQGHKDNPGKLSLADLAGYQPKKREPICIDYKATTGKDYSICGMPPPSSGMIAIGQILGILANTPSQSRPLTADLPSADWLHDYLEASRLAFADRAKFLGDPDFVQAPGGNWKNMLAPAYLAERAKLIGAQSLKGTAQAGNPGAQRVAYGMPAEQPEYGTSHISVIDAYGNALSMTTTIEDAFGARQMVNPSNPSAGGGFLLNNELTDFNYAPNDAQGQPTANRVEPGKRPRSSMNPTLIFDKSDGKLVMTGGSPGGALIIHYTAKTIYGMLNWGLNAQQAIDLPNFGATGALSLLEEKRFPTATVQTLKDRGHEVREQNMTSGLQAIGRVQLSPGTRATSGSASGWLGGADPRREGVVRGD